MNFISFIFIITLAITTLCIFVHWLWWLWSTTKSCQHVAILLSWMNGVIVVTQQRGKDESVKVLSFWIESWTFIWEKHKQIFYMTLVWNSELEIQDILSLFVEIMNIEFTLPTRSWMPQLILVCKKTRHLMRWNSQCNGEKAHVFLTTIGFVLSLNLLIIFDA